PKRLLIIGGGPIGCELAQAMARLGSTVIQVERSERILGKEDPQVSELIQKQLLAEGVQLQLQTSLLRFEAASDDSENPVVQAVVQTDMQGQAKQQTIAFDEVIFATGRRANLSGLGLEKIGIDPNQRLVTNDFLQTIFPHIYAAGDVVGKYQFTHVASHHAWYSSVNALFGLFKRFKVDYSVIPWVTFTAPEVARVGLNETQAKEKGLDYELTRYDLSHLDRAITESHTQGFIEVITPKGEDKILGVTIVSERAGELLSEFTLAMKHGLGLKKIMATIHPYPTWNEAVKAAASEWQKAHKPDWLMPWLKKFHAWRRS
ncbi:MAG: FAD-dependent oxidoreductase, partial [Pseudomonadota bacterium]|nr:FAD-dependent oxidoreductase [Pseudomonadota bacterium]